MMSNFFEGADYVLVWLGEADAESITLAQLFKHGLPADLVREGKYALKKLLWHP